MVDLHKTTQVELVSDLKAVSKNTTSNTIHNGLKSCSAWKVQLPKESHIQAHLKFAGEHLNDPVKASEMKSNLSSLAST